MASGDACRRLAQSSLYTEDRPDAGGHASVWGSFFDREGRRWGYGCCRGTERGRACPLAAKGQGTKRRSSESSGDEDAAAGARGAQWALERLLDDAPEEEPGVRGEAWLGDEEFLAHFVRYWFRAWSGAQPDAAAGGRTVEQTREALLPLLRQLRRREVPKDMLQNLAAFADFSVQREYSQANDVYVGITIGKALWHSNLDLGEQRANWGGGQRTMQRQVVEKDQKNASLFDTDPVVQRYVHALKRLVTHMQVAKPSEDPSKLGHVPAPAPPACELGLPILRGITDSDGGQREPEFVDPSDPRYSQVSDSRGLAFGRQAGAAHPFAGIGSARGV